MTLSNVEHGPLVFVFLGDRDRDFIRVLCGNVLYLTMIARTKRYHERRGSNRSRSKVVYFRFRVVCSIWVVCYLGGRVRGCEGSVGSNVGLSVVFIG